NFLVGSLYFRTKPNFDSLMPSIYYIENDIKKIVETLRW
ncbi:MAG: gliding motility lipoprotein GldD, partial [Flavobacteriaceae bacterium]|nr:gliding motility lipoprotein GldD [Flavobacteriaceae bacterium]